VLFKKAERFEKLLPIHLASLRWASASSFQINYFQAGSFPRLVCWVNVGCGFLSNFQKTTFFENRLVVFEQLAHDPQVLNWRATKRTVRHVCASVSSCQLLHFKAGIFPRLVCWSSAMGGGGRVRCSYRMIVVPNATRFGGNELVCVCACVALGVCMRDLCNTRCMLICGCACW
jgi:hypothetical protein